ncbi:trimeric intracellular cation channel family protein [Porphyromonas sp.]|uniref:trimeric intracellular cation channel family protein n=1 Tax=Porphyromonas sp. TaxID=1924944 RepID=UPI0026DB1916|nr:trimeric intracellular cation channel family protein [Porphyromonas sp.]MDO4771142.1 trimeric intracellular cation channel family protein [Porphyromonas sp.]
MIDFITLCDYLGTFAFAVSGIRLASSKQIDLFGAYVIGLTTAVGGGTLRDLFLGLNPFWMTQPSYLIITFIALLYVAIFRKTVIRMSPTVFIFDAIGLGLFVIVGMDKAFSQGYPAWVAIVMGVITGSFGGLIRDIFLQEIPLIFRKDIYALACVIGGLIYTILYNLPIPQGVAQLTSAISVIICRILAAKFHLSLPTLKGEDSEKHP